MAVSSSGCSLGVAVGAVVSIDPVKGHRVSAIKRKGVGMAPLYSSSVILQIGRKPWLPRLSVSLPQRSSVVLALVNWLVLLSILFFLNRSSSLARDPLRSAACFLM